MTTYYCDLDTDFVAHRNGTDSSTNVLTGVAGLQTICNGWDSGSVTQLVAGDTIYIKGTAELSKWVRITVNLDKSGTWGIGDTVRNYNDGGGTPGDDWTGTLANITATNLWVWLTSGTVANVSTTDGVDNTTQTDQIPGTNMTGAGAFGWNYNGNSGDTTSGMIRFIGVNSSWSVDGTLAIFDGELVASPCLEVSSGLDDSRIEYMHFTRGVAYNITLGNNNTEIQWIYCKSDLSTGLGWDAYSGDQLFYHCIARSNSSYGISGAQSDSVLLHCVASDNGNQGLQLYYAGTAIGCLSTGNSADGIGVTNAAAGLIVNCTCDGNGDNGIELQTNYASHVIAFCRLTNNVDMGLQFDNLQLDQAVEFYNYYYGNTIDDVSRKDDTTGCYYHEDTTEDGYVDRENRDYDIKPDSPLCSEKLLLEWDL